MIELLSSLPAMLAEVNIDIDDKGIVMLGGLLGCGLIVIGAGLGIGNLAGRSTEAIARQPEAGGRIFTCMLIAASLIEGATLIGLIICLLPLFFM